MKKTTIQTIVNYLNTTPIAELTTVKAELEQELAKNAERAQANRDLYEDAGVVVLANLTSTPVTVAELFDAIAEELPNGFTKGKLSYALSRGVWDGIVKIDGTPCTYRKA